MGRSAAKRGRGRDSTRTARVMKLMKKPAAGRSGRPVGGKPAGRFVAKRGKLRDSARTIRIMKLMKKPAAGRNSSNLHSQSSYWVLQSWQVRLIRPWHLRSAALAFTGDSS